MLFHYSNQLCLGGLLLTFIFYLCAGYAYHINAQRAPEDPEKRNIPLAVVLFGPMAWPVLLFGVISLFLIKALVYSIFLVFFAIALLVIRKPFLIDWLKKSAVWIGDRLLRANIFLMKMAFGDWEKKTTR
jgi:hypothetical protein